MSCCEDFVLEVVCAMAFEPVIITDGAHVVACNEGACEMFEYGTDDLVGLEVRELIDLHFEPTHVVDAAGAVRPAQEMDLTFAKAENENSVKKSASVNTKAWENEGKQFYTITIIDIPIVRVANNKRLLQPKLGLLDECNAKHQTEMMHNLSQMADALPGLIWIASKRGEILYQNSHVKDVFGVDSVTECWQECIHPVDALWAFPMWVGGLHRQEDTNFEIRYCNIAPERRHEERSFRWFFAQTKPIPNTNNSVLYSVDVHDLKEAERERQELIARERLAVESNQLKSEFLSMMSHEIRTPLFGIVGNISLLKDTSLSSGQRELIANIEGSAKLMMAVIQDILDFSRIEAGKMRIRQEPFSFNRTLALCRGMVEQAATRKGLEFAMAPLSSQVNAVGDSMRILQVLNNLASNAVKFTATGSVEIAFDHTVTCDTLNVKMTVADTGIGFGPEMHAKLFTPWVQADDTHQRLYGGSGLGLAISKAILDLMGGTILAESEVGVGSRFVVGLSLPALRPDFDLSTSRSETEAPSNEFKYEMYCSYTLTDQPLAPSTSTSRFRILLAEDVPINQAILHVFLEKMDVACVLVANGKLALEEYLKHPKRHFHIVLLDQSMPHMDGDAVCRHIRVHDPQQIVISVSANALLADAKDWRALGLDDHIPKPVDFASFQKVISHWLNQVPTLYA